MPCTMISPGSRPASAHAVWYVSISPGADSGSPSVQRPSPSRPASSGGALVERGDVERRRRLGKRMQLRLLHPEAPQGVEGLALPERADDRQRLLEGGELLIRLGPVAADGALVQRLAGTD